MKKYIGRVSIAFSIFVNALLGGKNNQTFSAGQYGRKQKRKWNVCWAIDLAFYFEQSSGHCQQSWVKWEIIDRAINQYDNIGRPRRTVFDKEELKEDLDVKIRRVGGV